MKKFVSIVSVATVFLLSANVTIAASACKGLEQTACDAEQQCSWVAGYERKDGRKVNAFCRTKSGGKTVSKAESANNTSADRSAGQ